MVADIIPHTADGCFELTIVSGAGLEYRLLFSEPEEPPPEAGYGIVFALDGDATFRTLAETVRMQTRKPKGYEPIVVVGIGYPSRQPFDLERRCRDFTMLKEGATLPKRPDGREWPPHGEADRFLDFLEREVLAWAEKRWRLDPARRAIVGHSLGGLLVLHALFVRPRLFTHYVAGSPSVWWADQEVLNELEHFKRERRAGCSVRLLLAIGAEELEDMLEGVELVAERAAPLVGEGFGLEKVLFPGEEHTSVLPSLLSRVPKLLSTSGPRRD
ncbi:alpha/beta hydrolase [Cohnella fermenti]|uniref:Alpha/beta hydrolase n=2 Tax=Cohnella fermenti TaxID=2565925 RepID=A0A4S4C4N9_9BACL|nr:alpha/beta hydrolase [Cohnella fermenti]